MKKLFCIAIPCILFSTLLIAQSVGINTTSPHNSAILDVKSNTKGLLLPRTSTSSRIAIASPAKGLMIYDTTTSSFWFNTGATWTEIATGSNGWSLTGNTGTNPTVNFLGTIDESPLAFRVNNTQAGFIDTTSYNTSIGFRTLDSITTGTFNLAAGYKAMAGNSAGEQNTAVGANALRFNKSGSYNTAVGLAALLNNTNGNNNTATGLEALINNTAGNFNTANGVQALYANTTAINNTAIGAYALLSQSFDNGGTAWESNNVAIGYEALLNNEPTSTTNGISNTAIGTVAMRANVLGFDNTAVGAAALYTNFNGKENTAIGRQSLFFNTSGYNNTATGYKALRNNDNGVFNTATGCYSLVNNIDGVCNTGIGYNSNTSTGGLTNATAIGFNATVNASNKVRIGDASVTVIEGQVNWSFPSDGRFKTHITESVKGLDFITRLRPVVYNFQTKKYDAFLRKGMPDNNVFAGKQDFSESESIRQSGFVAQEVEKAAKESGYDFNGIIAPKNDNQAYGLSYSQFVVPLVKAVQELNQKAEQQQIIIEEQNKKIERLLKELKLVKEKLK